MDNKQIEQQLLEIELSLLAQVKRLIAQSQRMGTMLLQENKISMQVDQIEVFMHVYFKPGITQHEIATESCRDKASVNRTMKSLIQLGLITMATSPKDRRINLITTTKKGNEEAMRFWTIRDKMETTLKLACGEKEYNEITEKLKIFANKLEEFNTKN